MNRELPDVQARLRKGRGTRDEITNICWIMEKPRRLYKNIYFCFIDYVKAFDYADHHKLWKILRDERACLLRNLYVGQEAAVRIGHERTDSFRIVVYCHLTSVQSTSYEMPSWMIHKLKLRLLGEIPTILNIT